MRIFYLSIMIVAITGIAAYSQDNPYDAFGYKSNVKYRNNLNRFYKVVNNNKNSPVKALVFNIQEQKIILIGANDTIISIAKINPEQLLRWWSVDPKTSERVGLSPYNFCSNNPISRTDPNGALDDVYINGDKEASKSATNQLQTSTSLTLSRDDKTGKLSATGEAKNSYDKLLLEAINNSSINVNINAKNSDVGLGGQFWGNTVVSTTEDINFVTSNKPLTETNVQYNKTIVNTNQLVIPSKLKAYDFFGGTPGQSMLHEVTESYIGGLISLKTGVSAEPAYHDIYNPIYENAHNNASPQPLIKAVSYDSFLKIQNAVRNIIK